MYHDKFKTIYILDKEKRIIHKRLCKHIDSILEKSRKEVIAHYCIPADYKDCLDCKPNVCDKS